MNTILKFELPDNFIINHNDLSEFSRYFYPYVALVIEPRKRQAKVQKGTEKSKFGTYLRYKRVSKYENQGSRGFSGFGGRAGIGAVSWGGAGLFRDGQRWRESGAGH